MSTLLIAACVAVGTPFALLSLAYLAAASAYRRQELQDEEAARLWDRARPIAPAVVIRPIRRRARVTASCAAIGKPATPTRRRAAGSSRH